MSTNKFSKEYVKNIVKQCSSIADFCRYVGWKPRGDNYRIFHKYVYEYDLDISHFIGYKSNTKKNNSEEYLIQNSYKITSNRLLKKLLEEGKKEYKCECCGLSEWNGKSISLELHHINGEHYDNRIENIQVLCPNCHAQTENYRGKQGKKRKEYFCSRCGKKLWNYTKTGLCCECYRKLEQENSKIPTKEILLNDFNQLKRMSAIGRKYNVSQKTIKKWLLKYNIVK